MRLLALVLMLSCLNAARLAAANCLARLEVLRRALGTQGRQAKPSSEEKMTKLPTVGSDRKSTRLNSSHLGISYAVFCLKKKNSAVHVNVLAAANIPFELEVATHIPV